MDAVGPALGLLSGLRVIPWASVSQTHLEGQGFMQRVPIEERPFDHKCAAQRMLRAGCKADEWAQPVKL